MEKQVEIKLTSKPILIITLLLLICNLNAFAQESNNNISFNLNLPNIKNLGLDSIQFIQTTPVYQLENSLPTLKPYYGTEKSIYSKNPINRLTRFNFFSTSSNYNYGFEAATSAGVGANWHITDKLTLTGNPFLTSYYFGPTDYNRKLSVGANLMLTYEVTNWLIVRAFGQYAYNGLNDPYATSLIVPQNSFGFEVLIKFSKVFGLGGGIKYVNNRGKWVPQFYTLPLIKIDGAKLLKR